MHPENHDDVPLEDEPSSLSHRRLGLRLLAALLAGLWTGLALVVLLAYRPGGPWDQVVAITAALPAAVAVLAIVWPPLARSWRRTAAIVWLGLAAAMVIAPLVGLTVTQLVSGAGAAGPCSRRPRWPMPPCWPARRIEPYAALGVMAARDGRGDPGGPGAALSRRPSVFAAVALALVLTTLMAALSGGAVLLNEVALRESPAPPSRYGPTDASLPNPLCATPLSIGPGATLEVTAEAFIDDEPVGSARLAGTRSGTNETWTGSADGARPARWSRATTGWVTTRGCCVTGSGSPAHAGSL